ncbi:MAG: nitronate monooxygenase [Pseudomonadales bacterium]|jgi:nitronate monooxygenase
MQNALTERLGLECPLIQAPMAGVSTTEMAAAVSNAGALGSVALGALGSDAAREALRATRALTRGPIAANVFTHPTPRRDPELEADFLHALAPLFEQAGGKAPTALTEIYSSFNDDDAMLEVLLDERPDVVSVHFGLAAPGRMQALRGADIFVIATATSVAEADALERAGVDAVVAQGFDAGGHSGAFLSEPDATTAGRDGLIRLVRNAVRAVRVPVIAAGGLMSGRDVRAVIEAGASAAQLGTAFLACPESLAGVAYRRRLMQGGETRLTSLISGRPARGLVNPLIRALEGVSLQVPDYPIAYDAVKQLVSATADSDFSVMWAGAGVGRIRALGAAELIAALRRELEQSMEGSGPW